jgi:hypothetical protein
MALQTFMVPVKFFYFRLPCPVRFFCITKNYSGFFKLFLIVAPDKIIPVFAFFFVFNSILKPVMLV